MSDKLSATLLGQLSSIDGRYVHFYAKVDSVVNVQCFDDTNCFQYSVLAGMNVIKSGYHGHKCRASQFKLHLNVLNMDGIPNLVPLSHISKFEKQNSDIL